MLIFKYLMSHGYNLFLTMLKEGKLGVFGFFILLFLVRFISMDGWNIFYPFQLNDNTSMIIHLVGFVSLFVIFSLASCYFFRKAIHSENSGWIYYIIKMLILIFIYLVSSAVLFSAMIALVEYFAGEFLREYSLEHFYLVQRVLPSLIFGLSSFLLLPLAARLAIHFPSMLSGNPLSFLSSIRKSRGYGLPMALAIAVSVGPFWAIFRLFPNTFYFRYLTDQNAALAWGFYVVEMLSTTLLMIFVFALIATAYNRVSLQITKDVWG